MNAEDIFGILVPVTFVAFLVTERMFPRREYPPIRFWNLIGFGCLILTALIGTWLPMLLPPWLTSHHLFDASRLGIILGVLIGYPVSALAMALVHRSCHEFHPLWMWMGHQVHHSPRNEIHEPVSRHRDSRHHRACLWIDDNLGPGHRRSRELGRLVMVWPDIAGARVAYSPSS